MKALLAFGLMLSLAVPAIAQGLPCGNRASIIKALAAKYKESPKFIAIAGQGNLVEIFISKSGTWTILNTTAQGLTCAVAAGDSWEELPPVTIIDGHDS